MNFSINVLVTSMQCFNKEIEWNYAYFKKIRLCFYRKLKDVKFVFRDPSIHEGQGKKKGPEIDYLLSEELPSVSF